MNPEESHAITLTINGGVHRLNVHPNRTLNDVSRKLLDLTGTQRACDYGGCGSCTVLMDGHFCLSNHPSDTAVALAALDARVHAASPRGAHATPISEFFSCHTWVDGRLQFHSLPIDEIVTEIEVPFRPTHSSYLKFALRKTWNFAIASMAASAVIRNNLWEDLRIVVGGHSDVSLPVHGS